MSVSEKPRSPVTPKPQRTGIWFKGLAKEPCCRRATAEIRPRPKNLDMTLRARECTNAQPNAPRHLNDPDALGEFASGGWQLLGLGTWPAQFRAYHAAPRLELAVPGQLVLHDLECGADPLLNYAALELGERLQASWRSSTTTKAMAGPRVGPWPTLGSRSIARLSKPRDRAPKTWVSAHSGHDRSRDHLRYATRRPKSRDHLRTAAQLGIRAVWSCPNCALSLRRVVVPPRLRSASFSSPQGHCARPSLHAPTSADKGAQGVAGAAFEASRLSRLLRLRCGPTGAPGV